MPQMAPMSWLFLYYMFIIILMWFNLLNYYLFIYFNKNKLNNKNMKNIKMNWMW